MRDRRWLGHTLMLAFLIAFPTVALPATVTKVNKKKKIITIDGGSGAGFKKGAKVCIFEDSKKIGCGSIKSAKKDSATLKLKKADKVKEGFTAELDGADKGDASEDKKSKKSKNKNKGEKGDKGKDKGKKNKGKSDYNYGILGFWPIYLMPSTAANFHKLSYNGLLGRSSTPASLWKSEGLYSASGVSINPMEMMLTAGGELDLKALSLRLGFHYKQYRPFAAISDYLEAQGATYIESSLTGNAIGGYLDYAYDVSPAFSIGAGLDFDMSSLTMIVNSKNDDDPSQDGNIMSGTSKATILSLRIPVRYHMFFPSAHIGLYFGMNLMIPITAMGVTNTMTYATAEPDDNVKAVSAAGDDAELAADFGAALGHGKSSYVLEFPLGLIIGF